MGSTPEEAINSQLQIIQKVAKALDGDRKRDYGWAKRLSTIFFILGALIVIAGLLTGATGAKVLQLTDTQTALIGFFSSLLGILITAVTVRFSPDVLMKRVQARIEVIKECSMTIEDIQKRMRSITDDTKLAPNEILQKFKNLEDDATEKRKSLVEKAVARKPSLAGLYEEDISKPI